MAFLGLLAAVTVTATVTVETAEGVRPAAHAVLYQVAPVPAAIPPPATPSARIRCTPAGLEPSVSVVRAEQRLYVENDRAALTQVRIVTETGLVLLTATLVSGGQVTPMVRLPPGRARIECRTDADRRSAHVLVLPHGRYTVGGADGVVHYEADAGSRWRAWHPELGRVDYTFTASVAFPRPTF